MHAGPLAPAALRRVLAAVVAIDLCLFPGLLGADRAAELARVGTLPAFGDLLSRLPVAIGVAAIGLLAIGRFVLRPGRLGAGGLALLALILCNTAHAEIYGSPWRHLYYAGLVLAGWLAGVAMARWRGTPDDESWARTGGLALLGAAYLNAGISKLAYGGVDWLSGAVIQAIIVSQDGMAAGDDWLTVYRHFIVTTPVAVSLFSIATVVFELAGPLMLFGRWPRLLVAAGLLGMHLNILLLTHILYWQSMVLLTVFALSADPAEAAPAAAPERRHGFALAAAGLALLAAIGIVHQARRYVATQAQLALANLPPTPVPPTPATLRIGPFTVGQTLADGWRLDTLTRGERGFTVATSGPAGVVSFEITCAELPYVSPFDLGAVHILYSSRLDPPLFTALGHAVRDQVRTAAGDADPCAAVRGW